MAYILVIVESPSKCNKIEQYLNNHPQTKTPYKCMASYGHIRELDGGLTSIDIHNNFAPTFIECESKKEQISKLKKAIKNATEVILASDDDREGEAIAWHLCQLFNLPVDKTKRILFHEITESALHRAIDTPTRVKLPVVQAQLARQILDVLVGYTLSPLLWKHVQDGLSAGRCQTPALRLIYENEREIASATGKQSYTIIGYFTNATIPFVLNHEETDKSKVEDFLKASLTYAHQYNNIKLQTKNRVAPEPFTTSSIQQYCSNELHLSPKETMSICQSLYEDGYITYHRTDSKVYSEEFKGKAFEYIKTVYGEEYLAAHAKAKAVPTKAKAVPTEAVQAHEAIRITDLYCKSIAETINKKENRVYQLIRQRTLESCMTEATVSVLTATITAPEQHLYQYTTEQIIFPGWKIAAGTSGAGASGAGTSGAGASGEHDGTGKNYAYLQTLKPNMPIRFSKIKANVHVKELKAHYTEARLVQLLEEKGIGRPSTFSSLIEKIQERKYVKKTNVKGKLISCVDYEMSSDGQLVKITTDKEFGNEKNKLLIQPVGTLSLEFLLNHFDTFFQYTYTKQMEDALDAVAKGEKVWHEVCKECYTELSNLSSAITEKGKETIRIDANHTYMIGKYGPVIKCIDGANNPLNNPLNNKRKNSYAPAQAPATFKAVRKDIDLNKLRRGEYTLEDIIATDALEPDAIGMYMDKPVYIKVGKFGTYLEWNQLTKSLKHLKQNPQEITLEDVSELLYDLDNDKTSSLRIITEHASICKGKYGNYILYKNKKMKKPRFLKLDTFIGDYLTCDLDALQKWFRTTYKVEE